MQASLSKYFKSTEKTSQAICSSNSPSLKHQDHSNSLFNQTEEVVVEAAEHQEGQGLTDNDFQDDNFDVEDLTDFDDDDDDVDDSQVSLNQECNLSSMTSKKSDESEHGLVVVEEGSSHVHASSNICTVECCSMDRNEPYQPLVDSKMAKRQQGQQIRVFQNSWFTKYKWLTYCSTRNVAYCFVCRKAKHLGMFSFSKKADDAFLSSGFKNWKNATLRFKKHEKSDSHQVATMRYMAFLKSPGINSLMSSETKREQSIRRQMLVKEVNSLRYLARQGLAFRGHENSEGNFCQIMNLQVINHDDQNLKKWLSSNKYMSPEILNEIIELMAKAVLRSILSEVQSRQSVPYFAIIADETRDISGKEQLAVSLRWVSESYDTCEDLIGLFCVDKTDASTLVSVLKDVLIRCNLPLSKCCGQTYDGASNMAGHLNGVAAKISREEPKALFIHCLAHSINLCLQDCAKLCKSVKDALGLVNEIYNLINASPKRLAIYNELKKVSGPDASSLRPLCPTRWTVRTGAIAAILKNYLLIQQTLEEIVEESSGDASSKASGLICLMDKFSTFFGLKLAYLAFVATEQLATTLQAKDVNAQICMGAVKTTKAFLQSQRNDTKFISFFESVKTESMNLTDPPTLPRRRHIPRGNEQHQSQLPSDYFRQQYFETFDVLTQQLDDRFHQQSLDLSNELETILVDASNGKAITPSDKIIDLYGKEISFDRLQFQIGMLPDLVNTENEKQAIPIKQVTSVSTICELFNSNPFAKTMLCEVHKLMMIYLTVPMTSATAERSFSSLRRLKSYLRSTMTQKKLNHVTLLHVHKKRTDEIDVSSIVQSY